MKAKKLPFIDKVFLWINAAFCLALLIGYFAPVTNPQKFWPVAFFGLAYLPVLLINFLLIVYWLLRKRWYVLLSVLAILCGLNVFDNNIAFHYGHSDPAKPQDANNIRLMTYNVHGFKKFGAKKDISTKHEILEIIKHEQPDIIGFQEFYTRKRGQYNMIDSLKKIIGENYYYQSFSSNQDESSGMAIFSRFPIISKGFIQLSTETESVNQCLYVDVKNNNRLFRVYSVHLQSIHFEPEDYRYLDTISKSGIGDIPSTRRLGGKLKRAFLKRSEQMLKVKTDAQHCPYPYIISGDFNDTPSSYAVNQMAKGLKNAFREKGFGLGRTYNGNFPNYQIDYVMAVPQFHVTSYTITEKKLSDHYPVCVDLMLK